MRPRLSVLRVLPVAVSAVSLKNTKILLFIFDEIVNLVLVKSIFRERVQFGHSVYNVQTVQGGRAIQLKDRSFRCG